MLSDHQALQIIRKSEKQHEAKQGCFIVPFHRTADAKGTGRHKPKTHRPKTCHFITRPTIPRETTTIAYIAYIDGVSTLRQ